MVSYPSVASRDCLWIHWHTGCQEEFRYWVLEGGRWWSDNCFRSHILGGDQCGEQRGPDLKHGTISETTFKEQFKTEHRTRLEIHTSVGVLTGSANMDEA